MHDLSLFVIQLVATSGAGTAYSTGPEFIPWFFIHEIQSSVFSIVMFICRALFAIILPILLQFQFLIITLVSSSLLSLCYLQAYLKSLIKLISPYILLFYRLL